MNAIKLISIAAMATFLFACEEVIDWSEPDFEEDGLVVEAIITDELKYHEVKLSGLFTNLNGEAPAISGAAISLVFDVHSISFEEDEERVGTYISEQEFAAEINEQYSLLIDLEGQHYEAEAHAVAGTPMRYFPFHPYLETDSVSLGNIGVEYHPTEQSMYLFEIDWSHIIPDGKTRAKLAHYIFNSVNIGQLFGPARDQFVFPRGSIVVQKKYSLEEDFASYLRSLVIETQWKGGFFEEAEGNLPGNISNGAYGFFAVCSVKSDTLIAE